MDVAVANKTDIYLIDEKKAVKVGRWLKKIADGEDKIKSFIKGFPDDPVVCNYLEKKSIQAKQDLELHVDVILSGVPLKFYFDAHGLTDSHLLGKLKKHIDSDNADISLKALKVALRYKNPEEKTHPVKANQNNFFIDSNAGNKQEIIDRIMSKMKVVSE